MNLTRQEAIEVLKANYPTANYSELCEAVDMALKLLQEYEPIVRCKDCKYYEVENHYVNFYEYQVLAAPEVSTCHRWGDDVCMVRPDGHCYLAERR